MNSNRNDGKKLEKLVALVEGMDLPKDFKLEVNKPVHDDEGNQIAELDILISGVIGTVTYKTLFECRDRPSGGSQGVGWIEQLVGRRDRLHLNAIVAVSTTGFAPGAITYATEANVPLRNVAELTVDDIRSFIPLTAPMVISDAAFNNISIEIYPEELGEEFDGEVAELKRIPISTREKILLNVETGESFSLLELWQKLVLKHHNEEIFKSVNRIGDQKDITVEVDEEIYKPLRMEVERKRNRLQKLIYYATVKMYPSNTPLAYCYQYDERHVIAHWEDQDSGDNLTVILTKKKPDGE